MNYLRKLHSRQGTNEQVGFNQQDVDAFRPLEISVHFCNFYNLVCDPQLE